MTEVAASPLDRARKLGETASVVATIAAVIIVVTTVVNLAGPAAGALREQKVTLDLAGLSSLGLIVLRHVILAVPNFLLAGAIYELSKVLDEYGKGQFFTLRASVAVRKAGEDALWALAFKILISPTVYAWVTHEGRGFIWHYEPFDLGLVAFAAFVMVLGRVLEAAARIKAENDQIV
ncbi:MAG: DUF2975 domain-containing protein [Hyphomonadaceae bacterium]